MPIWRTIRVLRRNHNSKKTSAAAVARAQCCLGKPDTRTGSRMWLSSLAPALMRWSAKGSPRCSASALRAAGAGLLRHRVLHQGAQQGSRSKHAHQHIMLTGPRCESGLRA